MVDVCRVIEGPIIDINGLVPIPAQWIICHCALSNLKTTSDINVMLDSPRVSERIVGEILLAYESDALEHLGQYSWLFYNTKRKGVEGLLIPNRGALSTLTFVASYGRREILSSPMIFRSGRVKNGFKDAIQEREYNEKIQRYFCKGLSVKLATLSPILGNIVLRSVSAYEEPKRERVNVRESVKGIHEQLMRREAWKKQHGEDC